MLSWDDLSETVDFERVLDELGILVTEVRRGEHMASCPLPSHPGVDANPSFSVNEDSLLWHCFTCDDGGGLPSLVIRVLGLEDDSETDTAWQKALRWLLSYTDHAVDTDMELVESVERYLQRSQIAPKRFRSPTLPSLSPRLLQGLKTAPVALTAKWHITQESTLEHFQVKYDEKHSRKDYVGPALIIPHFFQGNLVGYQERWLDEDRPSAIPKYTNTDDFPKKETLFNWDGAIDAGRAGDGVLVVESVMTVIRLFEIGIPAVSTFGASVKDEQLRLLGSLPTVILAFDNDGPGKKATKKVADGISDYTDLWIVPFAPGEKSDLADLSQAEIEVLMADISPYTYV